MLEMIWDWFKQNKRYKEREKNREKILQMIEEMKTLKRLCRESGLTRTERRKLFRWVWSGKEKGEERI